MAGSETRSGNIVASLRALRRRRSAAVLLFLGFLPFAAVVRAWLEPQAVTLLAGYWLAWVLLSLAVVRGRCANCQARFFGPPTDFQWWRSGCVGCGRRLAGGSAPRSQISRWGRFFSLVSLFAAIVVPLRVLSSDGVVVAKTAVRPDCQARYEADFLGLLRFEYFTPDAECRAMFLARAFSQMKGPDGAPDPTAQAVAVEMMRSMDPATAMALGRLLFGEEGSVDAVLRDACRSSQGSRPSIRDDGSR